MNSMEDIAIHTRVRLARNLKEYPFPNQLDAQGKEQVNTRIKDCIIGESSPVAPLFSYVDLNTLTQEETVSLVECQVIGPELIEDRRHKAVLLMPQDSISILLNGEDHLRIQVQNPGMDFEGAFRTADHLDTFLEERLAFAFDERLGYLTECPENLGTGLRASVMLHLPALQENGVMGRLASSLSKLGITLRAVYPEGAASKGALYQLSNRVTLGLSEQAAIENLQTLAGQLAQQERAARDSLRRDLETLDAIGRSLGILRGARLLSLEEFMQLISNVRLGISLGVIDNISYEQVNALLFEAQPATLMKKVGRKLSLAEQESLRAEMMQQSLKA